MAQKTVKNVTVSLIALGCPKNIIDSEKMLAHIAQAGLLITPDPENADVVVINTCGFIAPAKTEAYNVIENVLRAKQKGNVKKVIVAGCLPQRMGHTLFDELPGIDAVVGLNSRDQIADIVSQTLISDHPLPFIRKSIRPPSDDSIRLLIGPPHRAYLRISEGCNHKCSFCTIPAIRGPFHSKPEHAILAEAKELASAGVVELTIIGQDTTSYGRDLKIEDTLAELLLKLDCIDSLVWIRLMYSYPAGITQRLIETIAKMNKIANYLDMPIQHVNSSILKMMRRPHSKDHLYKLIENLRSIIPDIMLRTTIIVGFPGETDDQFAELLDFIEWAQFDALGAFPYYREEGTPAAQLSNQIPDEVKQQRLNDLMLAQQQIVFTQNKQRIGNNLLVLVDCKIDDFTAHGRYYGQAPEVDSICIIKDCSAESGQFINTEVIATQDYDLIVRQI